MKIQRIILAILILFSLQSYSQKNPSFQTFKWNEPSAKLTFIYKIVDGHKIKANIFLPPGKEKHPVFVYFHGGGFIFGNRDRGLDILLKERLLANNYAVISADYRLAPETKLDEIIHDVHDMIKWVRQNGKQKFNLDTDKIVAAGGSAGGYLAFSTGFSQISAPNAIVAISAPTGFSTANIQMGDLSILKQPGPYQIVNDSVVSYGDYSSRMALLRFLDKNKLALYEIFGFDPASEPEKLKKYTLTNNIKSNYPPTLIIQAKNDPLMDLNEATALYDFLKKNKIESRLYLVENGHSSELIKQNPDAVDEIISFLNSQLKR